MLVQAPDASKEMENWMFDCTTASTRESYIVYCLEHSGISVMGKFFILNYLSSFYLSFSSS